jgi:hypothetical protein
MRQIQDPTDPLTIQATMPPGAMSSGCSRHFGG